MNQLLKTNIRTSMKVDSYFLCCRFLTKGWLINSMSNALISAKGGQRFNSWSDQSRHKVANDPTPFLYMIFLPQS